MLFRNDCLPLTLTKALDISKGMESAAKNSAAIITDHVHASVAQVHQFRQSSTNCYRCGKQGHNPSMCKFREFKCYSCGKLGHLKKVCRSTQKATNNKRQPQPSVKRVTAQTAKKNMNMYSIVFNQQQIH